MPDNRETSSKEILLQSLRNRELTSRIPIHESLNIFSDPTDLTQQVYDQFFKDNLNVLVQAYTSIVKDMQQYPLTEPSFTKWMIYHLNDYHRDFATFGFRINRELYKLLITQIITELDAKPNDINREDLEAGYKDFVTNFKDQLTE